MSGEKIKEILRDYGNPVYRFKAFYVNEALEELDQLEAKVEELEEEIRLDDLTLCNVLNLSGEQQKRIATLEQQLKEQEEQICELEKQNEALEIIGKNLYFNKMKNK